MLRVSGRPRPPSSALAVMLALVPMLIAAAAKNPVAFVAGTLTMPSFEGVAPMATMSGVGVLDADRMKVLTPGMLTTGGVSAQSNTTPTSSESSGALGVKPNTKFWVAPGAMLMGVFGAPMSWLAAFVV